MKGSTIMRIVSTHIRRLTLSALILSLMAVVFPTQASADEFITIGTGGVTGVYYPTGGALCRLVNRGRKEHGIRCSVESTGGSIYNINALRKSEMEFAIAQSDWHYHAYNGTGFFEPQGKMEELRSVFSLHPEAFTIVARADAGVNTLDDLKGKRVNIGNPGSGMRATMEELMRAKGWTTDVFQVTSELKASEQPQALCDNKIDVMIYAAGHPNGAIQEVVSSCETKIINVDGPEVDKLIRDNPFYSEAIIPAGMYQGTNEDVHTFGVRATLVTTSKVSDEIVYNVVKALFDNFENFKTLHPVFAQLDEKNMITEGNTAPLHPGAIRYYKEKGLMK